MIPRTLDPPARSFFLFGPRQTGKSTWMRSLDLGETWTVNLLQTDTHYRYLRDPSQSRRKAWAKVRDGTAWSSSMRFSGYRASSTRFTNSSKRRASALSCRVRVPEN